MNANLKKPTTSSRGFRGWLLAGVVLSLWFGLAWWVVISGYRLPNLGTGLPVTTLAGLLVPFAGLAVFWNLCPAFREWLLAIDLVTLTVVQCWRTLGAIFLVLWYFGVLPETFIRNGGLGDVATGILAAFAVLGLWFLPNFSSSRWLLGFHYFGMADLLLAIGSGIIILNRPTVSGNIGSPMQAMVQFPLYLVPLLLVPFFLMCHVLALLKIRDLKRVKA